MIRNWPLLILTFDCCYAIVMAITDLNLAENPALVRLQTVSAYNISEWTAIET